MTSHSELSRHLRPGQVYRRKDLARWSTSVDRHLKQLLADGRLEKVAIGLYAVRRKTRFGNCAGQSREAREELFGR